MDAQYKQTSFIVGSLVVFYKNLEKDRPEIFWSKSVRSYIAIAQKKTE